MLWVKVKKSIPSPFLSYILLFHCLYVVVCYCFPRWFTSPHLFYCSNIDGYSFVTCIVNMGACWHWIMSNCREDRTWWVWLVANHVNDCATEPPCYGSSDTYIPFAIHCILSWNYYQQWMSLSADFWKVAVVKTDCCKCMSTLFTANANISQRLCGFVKLLFINEVSVEMSADILSGNPQKCGHFEALVTSDYVDCQMHVMITTHLISSSSDSFSHSFFLFLLMMTLHKIKTILSTLKLPVEWSLRSYIYKKRYCNQ